MHFEYIHPLPPSSNVPDEISADNLSGCIPCMWQVTSLLLLSRVSLSLQCGDNACSRGPLSLSCSECVEFLGYSCIYHVWGVFSQIICLLLYFSSPSGTPTICILVYLGMSQRSLRFCSFILCSLFLLFLRLASFF